MAEKLERVDELEEGRLLQEKIVALLNKVENPLLLERIYRFVKYIYIHKG